MVLSNTPRYCSGSSKNDSGRRRRIVYLGALLNIWKLIKQKVAVDGTSQSYEGFVYGAMLCAPSKVIEREFNSLFDEQFNLLPSTQEAIKKHALLAHNDPIEKLLIVESQEQLQSYARLLAV